MGLVPKTLPHTFRVSHSRIGAMTGKEWVTIPEAILRDFSPTLQGQCLKRCTNQYQVQVQCANQAQNHQKPILVKTYSKS